MHNIKFRVWDSINKKFLDGRDSRFLYEDCIYSISIFLNECDLYMYDFTKNQFIVQQFTDMLDKDGTEIYVGDLIKTPGNLVKCIVFQRGRFCLADGSLLQVNPDGRSIYAKVVGNIFEEYHGT